MIESLLSFDYLTSLVAIIVAGVVLVLLFHVVFIVLAGIQYVYRKIMKSRSAQHKPR